MPVLTASNRRAGVGYSRRHNPWHAVAATFARRIASTPGIVRQGRIAGRQRGTDMAGPGEASVNAAARDEILVCGRQIQFPVGQRRIVPERHHAVAIAVQNVGGVPSASIVQGEAASRPVLGSGQPVSTRAMTPSRWGRQPAGVFRAGNGRLAHPRREWLCLFPGPARQGEQGDPEKADKGAHDTRLCTTS
jgi:hypothetical protein